MDHQKINLLRKGKTNWKFILIILILAVIVGGGILGYMRDFKREIISLTKFPEIKKPEKIVKDETANWKTYRNEKYGFEIKYPEKWYIDERRGENVSTPWFTLLEVILNDKKPYNYERPFITINVQNEEFVLGTRDWQDFTIGEIKGHIACDPVLGCEIIYSHPKSGQRFYITTNLPFLDEMINQILSTFRFLK